MDGKKFDVVIVGGGIAGLSAALRAAQNNLQVALLLGDYKTAKASRVKYVYNIDNMLGIHPTIMRDKYASLFKTRPEIKNEIETARFHLDTQHIANHTLQRLREEYSEQVTVFPHAGVSAAREQDFSVSYVDDKQTKSVLGRHLVLATGVADRQPTIFKRRGDRVIEGIQWVYPFANNESFLYCIRCEGHLTRRSNCAVIGFSEGAAQVALIFHERYGIPVSLITNGESLTASENTLTILKAYGIPIYRKRIEGIQGSDGGRVLTALVFEGGETLPVRYAMVAMGLYRVYNDLARELNAELESEGEMESRHVLVDFKGETSIPNLFAVGDMVRRKDEPVMKQIYTSQEYAVRAIDAIDSRIRKERRHAVLQNYLAKNSGETVL